MGRVYLPGVIDLVEPVTIEGPVGTSEVEADATRGVVGVHDVDGGRDLGVGDESTSKVVGLVDDVPCKANQCRCHGNERKMREYSVQYIGIEAMAAPAAEVTLFLAKWASAWSTNCGVGLVPQTLPGLVEFALPKRGVAATREEPKPRNKERPVANNMSFVR